MSTPQAPSLLRRAASILALPFTVTVIVPSLLVRSTGDRPVGGWAGIAGAVLLLAGAVLAAWCVHLFTRRGKGTLAPWDPPVRLVVEGPYRYVRNPMITGVLGILVGEALLFTSTAIGAWAVLFFVINAIYFRVVEEPRLLERFGRAYADYRSRTPAWWPRFSPTHTDLPRP